MGMNYVPVRLFFLCVFYLQQLMAQSLVPPWSGPDQTSITEKIASEIDAYLNAAVRFDQFSGSVLVARHGSPIVNRGFGMANYELSVPNSPRTVFQIASLTKQFTATAIMQLQERGKLKVSDPICQYLDNCPATWKPISIRQLLTHTSGIENFSSLPDWDEEISLKSFSRKGFVELFRNLPLEFEPGEKFEYSNSGYFLLGLIIERVSGKKYADFLQKNIFTPLEMKNTGSLDLRALLPHRADGYYWSGNSFVNAEYQNVGIPFGSGDLYSTTEDLLLWDQALYGEQLLSKRSLKEMFTPVKGDYGYGWVVAESFGRPRMGHSGSVRGFSTYFLRFPSEKITVIVLSNSDRTSATKAAFNLGAILFGEPYELPKPQLFDLIWTTISQKGIKQAIEQYRELRRTQADIYDFSEEGINELGYDLLKNGRVTEAIEVFLLGIEFYPQSSNPYDSLGEAYMIHGERDLAIKNYERSLALDATNENAVRMLWKLRGGKPVP